jgi:hypothetical protein
MPFVEIAGYSSVTECAERRHGKVGHILADRGVLKLRTVFSEFYEIEDLTLSAY